MRAAASKMRGQSSGSGSRRFDDAPRRMCQHVDVRVLDRGQRAPGQLLCRLVTPGVNAGDDHVVARQHLIGIVERGVRPDLDLGAVQDPKGRQLGVETRDLGALLIDAVGGEAAGHAERGRVVGEHDVLMSEVARGSRHGLDRVDAIGPVRVRVRVALHVLAGDERRQPAGSGGLDLAVALRAARAAIHGRPRRAYTSASSASSSSDPSSMTLNPFSDSDQPAVERQSAECDVVLLVAGEVDEMGAPCGGRTDHQVDPWTVAQDDAGLVRPGRDDLVDLAERIERRDDRRRVLDGREEVEIADGRLATRRSDPAGSMRVTPRTSRRSLHQAGDERIGVVEQQARVAAAPLDAGDRRRGCSARSARRGP